MKTTKFGAIKTTIGGIEFDSRAEAKRYGELVWLERAKDIKALARQPKYPLTVNGVTIGTYTPDFCYFEGGRKVCEDVKGVVTQVASLRMRLFKALYPDIELRTVKKGVSAQFKQRKVAA